MIPKCGVHISKDQEMKVHKVKHNISNTRDVQCFIGISKHQEESLKYNSQWSIIFTKFEVFKAVANEGTMLRTHCCGHKCFPICPCAKHFLRTQNLCPRHKNVSDFFQKHFVSATNVSRFAQHRNNYEQQYVSLTLCPRLPPPLDSQ